MLRETRSQHKLMLFFDSIGALNLLSSVDNQREVFFFCGVQCLNAHHVVATQVALNILKR
jgi:hypothetical protein